MPKIIENVREQLLAVAKKQIGERGYANTTIRSVAGECGLAVGTVYNYFKSKDMLIASFVVEDWNRYLSELRKSDLADPRTALRTIYDTLICFSEQHNPLFSDPDAAKVFSAVFTERHKTLRSQISELILPLCGNDDAGFTAEFVAESLLSWTVAGKDFDSIFNILIKILK
ncbi:MAG: TetR/AcrR family transcriptional regulator [Clostridia bacterium]|nr:TetR/AcrR family transcriptional regulator [Clostridia bacterium]